MTTHCAKCKDRIDLMSTEKVSPLFQGKFSVIFSPSTPFSRGSCGVGDLEKRIAEQ